MHDVCFSRNFDLEIILTHLKDHLDLLKDCESFDLNIYKNTTSF